MIRPETPSNAAPAPLLEKYETQELADTFFFRPLGAAIARAALTCGLTPNHLTLLAGVIGLSGGLLLSSERFAFCAFALLILHGIIDSADGQLARTTGQVTVAGFFLDGTADYFTDTAICAGIAAGILHHGGASSIIVWALLANLCGAIQAITYVYHRLAYAAIVHEGVAAENDRPAGVGLIAGLRAGYFALRRCLISGQIKIAHVLRARAIGPKVRDDDRIRYARYLYWPKRGWNLFGANTRFYAIGVLAWMHRLDLYFVFILIPMNLAMLILWLWQRRVERQFLAALSP